MPIKFRCQHCRQFLGISRGKAGNVVDCPTCGRSIRVPNLDGTVAPLPKPGLNLADSHLRSALDELASLGQDDADEVQQFESIDPGPDGDDLAQRENRIASAAPMIAVEPVAAPKPIDMPAPIVTAAAPVVGVPDNGPKRAHREASDPLDVLRELDPDDSDEAPISKPKGKPAGSTPASAREKTPSTASQERTRSVTLNSGFVLASVGIGAVIFAGGFLAGRLTAIRPAVTPVAEVPTGTAAIKTEAPVAESALRGRITYRTEQGDRKPDEGARVIVLPSEWNDRAKLKVDGFRLGDSADSQRVAKASVQAMGGDFVSTNAAGEYSASLTTAGKYQVIVLSNSVSRGGQDDAKADETICAQYFERPSQLFGKVRVHTEVVRYSGQGTEPWDYSF